MIDANELAIQFAEPQVNQPQANQPQVNQPQVNQPQVNQPQANQQVANQPVANQPVANQPFNNTGPVQSSSGQFFIKTLTGKTIVLDLEQGMTVADVKEKIYEQEGIDADQQRLVFQGKQLDDNETLDYYHIGCDATIHLVLRLR